jgi:CO/xanthine dehydrogenase Mo-binding subunit
MTTTRSGFLAGTAALVAFATADGVRTMAMAAETPPEKMTTLGAWLRMLPDGTIEHFTDKVEVGMGVQTGLAQLIADELDVPFNRVRMVMGDTAICPNQGGVGGSTTTFMGNYPVRHVAAQMRAMLVDAAAQKFGVTAKDLTVTNGVVWVTKDPARGVAYRDLLPALYPDPSFPQTGEGSATDVKVPSKPKEWTQYSLAGSPQPRVDAAPKAFGTYPYVVNYKLPGMLHGRMIYPPGIGRTLVSVDNASIKGIGDARVVRVGNFVGVVATREWDAIKASRALKVTWSAPSVTLPKMSALTDYMWKAPTTRSHSADVNKGDVTTALGNDAVEARYFWPFQTHANMGPGCTVVDVRADGVTVWSGTQKVHALRKGIAELVDVPIEKVRVVWISDAGSYGRGGLEESAGIAALLSKAVGKPVRVQSMRADNTQWGNKAPAIVGHLRGSVQGGKMVAFDALLREFNGNEILSRPDTAAGFIAGQLAGHKNADTFEFGDYGRASGAYEIPNTRAVTELIPPFAPQNSPMRTAHLRDPEGPGTTFIIESFIDELAHTANADAVAFRVAQLKDPRHIETVQAAAKAAGWETRPSATRKKTNTSGELLGRGIAFATRGPTIVATVAEVGVNPATGKVRVHRIVCAQDCGFVVNPKSLQGTVEANVVQSVSRSLYEQVTFDENTVTSVDWNTYPVLKMREVPEIVVVPLHRPNLPPGGAGEPSSRTTAAAIGNAIFDATGARVRTAPFTPANVLAAVKARPTA